MLQLTSQDKHNAQQFSFSLIKKISQNQLKKETWAEHLIKAQLLSGASAAYQVNSRLFIFDGHFNMLWIQFEVAHKTIAALDSLRIIRAAWISHSFIKPLISA